MKKIEDGTQGLHTMKINCKVFAIPILTAIVSIIIKAHAIRIMIANALELTIMHSTIFSFPCYFDLFRTFDP